MIFLHKLNAVFCRKRFNMQWNYSNVSDTFTLIITTYNDLSEKSQKLWKIIKVLVLFWLKIGFLRPKNWGFLMLNYLIKYVFGIKNYNPMHKLSADTNYLQTKITLQVRKLILQTEYSNTVELWKKTFRHKIFPTTPEICRIFRLEMTKNGYQERRNKPLQKTISVSDKIIKYTSPYKKINIKYIVVFYFYFFYTWLISSDFSDVLVETVMWKNIYGMTVNIWICSNR